MLLSLKLQNKLKALLLEKGFLTVEELIADKEVMQLLRRDLPHCGVLNVLEHLIAAGQLVCRGDRYCMTNEVRL